jgi:YfiH family protein
MTTPQVARGFSWQELPAGRVLVAEALLPYARHAFTTRGFGRRDVPDHDGFTGLAEFLELDAAAIRRVRQVHGREVVELRSGREDGTSQSADALVSFDASRAVAIAVADCVPILLADRRRRAVAAVHAGWRGTAARVVVAAVDVLARDGVPPSDLIAAIGPSIGSCCYQVDAPVRDALIAGAPTADDWLTPDGDGHWRLDLWSANRDQLLTAGLEAEAIHVARYCTADHLDDCYSYRREGAAAGRMFGAIRLRPNP